MATAPKKVVKGIGSKHSQPPGTRPEFTTVAAGQTGDGKVSSAYSNRSNGGTEFSQATSSIGNKG
jgi:hypothetical protein